MNTYSGLTAKDVDPSIYPERFESFQRCLMEKQCLLEEADEAMEGGQKFKDFI